MTEENTEEIYKTLKIKNIKSFKENCKHVKNIQKGLTEKEEKVALNVCPRCGKVLIKPKGIYGDFWGCSSYPKCHFTKPCEDENQ